MQLMDSIEIVYLIYQRESYTYKCYKFYVNF